MRSSMLRVAVVVLIGGSVAAVAPATTMMCQDAIKKNASSRSSAAHDKAIQHWLDKRIPMKFDDSALENILKYIDRETREPSKYGSKNRGIPIYVEPKGLQDVNRSMSSTINNINLADRPLAVSLKRVLAQLDLEFIVKDGVLFVSSREGINRERRAQAVIAGDDTKDTKEVLAILDEPVSMAFAEETALEDVLNYIRKATKNGRSASGIDFDVDNKGLLEVKKSMTSTVRAIDFEGVPLRTSLRLLLTQIGLAYIVQDGLVVISSPERVQKLKSEAAQKT